MDTKIYTLNTVHKFDKIVEARFQHFSLIYFAFSMSEVHFSFEYAAAYELHPYTYIPTIWSTHLYYF